MRSVIHHGRMKLVANVFLDGSGSIGTKLIVYVSLFMGSFG